MNQDSSAESGASSEEEDEEWHDASTSGMVSDTVFYKNMLQKYFGSTALISANS